MAVFLSRNGTNLIHLLQPGGEHDDGHHRMACPASADSHPDRQSHQVGRAMNRRVDLAGTSINAPSRGAVTEYTSGAANLFPLPAGSIRGALFEPSDLLHPSLHKFRSIERALLLVNGAAALVFTVFLLFAPL
jgi:hypothetical protein